VSDPIPNAPSVAVQEAAAAQAGFQTGVNDNTIADLCGFSIPALTFRLGFNLPPLNFPPAIPRFHLSLGLNCSLDNPFDFTAGFTSGGGRIGTSDPDPDLALDQATS